MEETIHNDYDDFTEEEIKVAQVLLQLPRLFSQSESKNRFLPTWALTKPRSSRLRIPSAAAVTAAPAIKAEPASSPATPLSFSPSESDDKSKRYKRKKLPKHQMMKEELLVTVKQLTGQNSELKREVEKVMNHYNKQKAINSELKARQLELVKHHEKKNPKREMTVSQQGPNLSFELVQGQVPAVKQSSAAGISQQPRVVMPQKPLIVDQTAHNPNGPRPQNQFSIPDLNVAPTVEEEMGCGNGLVDNNSTQLMEMEVMMAAKANKQQQHNLNKVLAAQARQKRLQLQRLKYSVAAKRPRFPLDNNTSSSCQRL